MPRFLLERVWDPMDEDDLARMAVVSQQAIDEQFPDLTWERSLVVSSPDGALRTFCVYASPNVDRLLQHSAVVACHRIANLYEIAGEVDPRSFPS